MNLYKEELMDHYRYPRNQGTISNPDFESEILNPSCGDQIYICGQIEGDKIVDIKFQGKGCVISQSAASMLTDFSINKSLETINNFQNQDMLNLIGIDLGPTRLRCALLSLEALKQGVQNYLNKVHKL